MARKYVKVVKKVSETSGESSWADSHVGEVFLAEWDKSINHYWVIENGERTKKLLTKSCVEVVTDLTNFAEQGIISSVFGRVLFWVILLWLSLKSSSQTRDSG